MKYLIAPALAALVLAGAASAETRGFAGFTSVSAQGRYRVELASGPNYSVEVVGSEASHVQTTLVGRELQIREINRPWFGGDRHLDAVVRIVTPRLDALAISRGVEAHAENVSAQDLALSVAMGGELVISGQCRNLSVHASMGAEVNARNLDCADATLSASMGGEIRATAHHAATASASMGGDIDVGGNPQQRSSSASMGGDINFH